MSDLMLGVICWSIIGLLFIACVVASFIGNLRSELKATQRLVQYLGDESWNQWFVRAVTEKRIRHDSRDGWWVARYDAVSVRHEDLLQFVDNCRELEAARELQGEIKQVTG